MRARHVVVGLLVPLLLGLAVAKDVHRPAPPRDAVTASGPRDEEFHFFFVPGGHVVLFGLQRFAVHRPATLLGADVPGLDPGLELVAARVVFLDPTDRMLPGGHQSTGWPGWLCAGHWPPSGFGEAYPIPGTRVLPDDQLGLVVYLRPRDPRAAGDYHVTRFRLRYRADSAEHTLAGQARRPVHLSYVARPASYSPTCDNRNNWLTPLRERDP